MNYAVFSWLVYILAATGFPRTHPGWTALLWFLIILVGSAMLGAGLGVAIQRDLFRPVFARLRLQPVHVVPTASDPEERDIYIEQVYRIDQDSTWHPMKHGHGTLIAHGEVRWVDFWPASND